MLGYRRKPRWIYLLALGLMLAPVASVFYPLIKVSPAVWTSWLKFVPWPTWVFCGLLISSGIALLFVRRWAWHLALGTLLAVALFDVWRWSSVGRAPAAVLLGMLAATGAAFVFLCLERFRRPYLNPRVRWWETSSRFRADLPVQVNGAPAVLVDISQTGVLVEWPAGDVATLNSHTTLTLPGGLELHCRVARRTARGYGLQFTGMRTDEKRRLKELLGQLATDPSRLARV